LLRGRLVTVIEAVKRETVRRAEHELAVQSIARDAQGVGQTI
jgi:DNA-binding GntR family transcriptional regulator